ncbi:hypothetical protein B0H16DRAFT_1479544 [Mycena metata]|uniref:Uncharacterized protein n=1 Tax=Mycena metata TaxID=1033252 RepID=A0AAD7MDI8_9AGAR|nr:hypothetical protein B0H16DRAFT_1479544 [Mycena metata]
MPYRLSTQVFSRNADGLPTGFQYGIFTNTSGFGLKIGGTSFPSPRNSSSGLLSSSSPLDFLNHWLPAVSRGVHSHRVSETVLQDLLFSEIMGIWEGQSRKSGKTLLWGWVLYCHMRCNINTILRIGGLVPKIDTRVTNAPLPAVVQSSFGCATEINSNVSILHISLIPALKKKFRDRISRLHGGVASSKRVAVKRVAPIALSPVKVHPQKKPRDFLKEMEAAGIKRGGNTHARL